MIKDLTPGQWKCVANPMRDDGWFVLKDEPPKPYDGNPRDAFGNVLMKLPPAIINCQIGNHADALAIAAVPDLVRVLGMWLMYMTNVNTYEPSEIGTATIAALSKAGFDKDELEIAAIATLKGAAHL
jgi:hypothetical protein